jgi:hypothetical protein
MSQTLHFLPWLRRGLGLTLTARDQGSGPVPRAAAVPAWIEIDLATVDAPLAMRPADHATAIDPTSIVRRFPPPNAVDAEWGYFPVADLVAPDLPWVLSPAAPDEAAGDQLSTGRLRPWVVLVCVPAATAEFVAAGTGRPARLVVPASELPDLAESYAWAHVQSAFEPDQVVASLTTSPGAVIARLVCPRRLEPNTSYRAAIVASFVAVGDRLHPAWTGADADQSLLVYDSWTFRTGDAHSFEELCQRLGPVADETLTLGLRGTDITDIGLIDPWPAVPRVRVDYAGALWDADVTPDRLGPRGEAFAKPVAQLLDRTELHPTVGADDPDPLVAPPFYGSFAAGADAVPQLGWMRELNLDPTNRMIAGRGADVVRRNQERFMNAAWRQAGEVRETNRQLSFTRLQSEIGSAWKQRADRLDPLQRVAIMRSQLSFARDGDRAPRRTLRDSAFPDALVEPAFSRITRPGSVVAKAASRRNVERKDWRGSVGPTFATPAKRRQVKFATTAAPAGTRFTDPRHAGPDVVNPTVELTDEFNLDATAALATNAVNPIAAGLTRLRTRIPGLDAVLGSVDPPDAPTRVAIGPVIDEALMWSLVEMSPELLLPGVDAFPNNSLRVVETNPAFVSAFMAGANHEMSRELLWREFPAHLAATTFRRFWDRPDRSVLDIIPIADWDRRDDLAEFGAGGGESVVLLIRGDLVRHYPNVRVLLVDPATNIGGLPSFGGWIPPDVRFMAYHVADADAVTAPGSRWRIAFEEQLTEPRFGLDTVAPGDPAPALASWDNLCWQHLTGHDGAIHLSVGDAFPSRLPPPPGATWGLNSAHMARATYQRPYRYDVRVEDLIGGGR